MEFFGLTSFGVSEPIKFLMREGYKEPDSPPDLKEIIRKGEFKRPFAELIKDLDMFSGILDGFSYKSYHRLIIGRERGFYRTIDPKTIYRDPITGSMEYGWFKDDPDLEGKDWYKKDVNWPSNYSEDTRFVLPHFMGYSVMLCMYKLMEVSILGGKEDFTELLILKRFIGSNNRFNVIGWFKDDPDLEGKDWPSNYSEETRHLNKALLIIKNFLM